MIIIIPAMLLQAIVFFIFMERHWSAVGTRLSMAVAGDISIVLRQFEALDGTVDPAEIGRILNDGIEGTGFMVSYDPAEKLTGQHGKIGKWFDISPMMIEKLGTVIPHDFLVGMPSDLYKIIRIRISLEDRGVLTVDMPENRLYTATSYIFVLWMLGSAVVLFTIAVLFMRNQVRPIRRLAVAVESFGRGMDAPDFRPEGALEVRQAGVSFLKMRERIRRQVEQRTAMLNGISHDLRTPVTRMKIEIEMLEDRETAEALKSDLDAMEKMLEGYLAFARGEQDEKGEAVSLNRFLASIVENARRQGGKILCNVENLPEIQCEVKALALSRALSNIIDNGCKYGSEVSVSLNLMQNDTGHDLAEILVEDNGPGIPEEAYGEVFRPFVRLEKSRNPETGGVGLGLSVAQDIIHSHGGYITLGARKDGETGLAVSIILPL